MSLYLMSGFYAEALYNDPETGELSLDFAYINDAYGDDHSFLNVKEYPSHEIVPDRNEFTYISSYVGYKQDIEDEV